MIREKEFVPEDFQKGVDFHGHVCPGLAIGYRAAKAGMEWLSAKRAEDEEVVAIVETDACGADAIQVLTGCTFGKGNFFHRDYGKQVFTLLGRKIGGGCAWVYGQELWNYPSGTGSCWIGSGKIRPPLKKEENSSNFIR